MNILIVVNAYVKNSSQISQAERIREELQKLGASVEIKRNFDLAEISDGGVKAARFDACVFLDKDRVAARLLEKCGMRLFNSADSIEVCDDKMLTSIALAGLQIPLPDSVYAPLCYYPDADINKQFLKGVEQKLGYPLVAKTNYGSLGAGVFLIKNFSGLCGFEEEHKLIPHFYQRFISCGVGEDVRVIVIGGKYFASMKRRNENDFRSNIGLGGTGENFVADERLVSLCEKVAKTLGLDYCGIDIIADKNGNRYVCEVNSNAFFAAVERVCKVNVARRYAEYIMGVINNEKAD